MADKSVGELIAAQSVTPTDLFVLEQNGTAKKLTGQILENWLVSFADGHGGIQSIEKLSTSGLVDTYRITLADTTTFDFTVTNGKSITGIAKTGTSGLVDTYKISYNDGSSQTYTVTNGAKGDKGNNAYVWIKYASQEPTESSHSMGDIPDNWIGIYSGNASTAPTDWEEYEWFKHKGEKGDTGIPATLVSTEIVYQSSDSGTIIPSGAWSTSIPVVAQGKYLWKRTTRKFNSGEPEVSYDVNRMGMDGSGSVSSVAGVSPDSDGNVTLTAADVGALAVSGGDMEGAINMNGQPISGLNDPTEDTQAAPKSYVDKRVPLDGSKPMTGNLAMGDHRITDLADPEDAADAATKGYADTKAALPKTASGTVIALSDASSGPLQGLRIFGRTTQDGTPTPDNPVELVSVGDGGSVGVSVLGRNLATINTSGNNVEIGYINANTDYTFCFIQDATTGRNLSCVTPYGKKNISFTVITGGKKQVLNFRSDYSGKLFLNSWETQNQRDFMLVVGTYSEYIDFEEPIMHTLPISTPNGLPGIPVTSGGNYTDADGQQWICDEVDFARGIYVQRIGAIDSYAGKAVSEPYLSTTGALSTGAKVLYVLATPIETPIPADELAAYAALHTNRPNTTIYNDAGAHMEVGYYPPDATMRQEDIRAYVDGKRFTVSATMRQEDIRAYVDGKRFTVSATITTSWTGDSAPYYNTVEVPGILATDFPHITPVYSSTFATAISQKEAWGMVTYAVSGDGSITFVCFEDKPATDIPIQIEVMR